MSLLFDQYELVKESREVVLDFCEILSDQDYRNGVTEFNKKSIRDLQVHVANVYVHWLGLFGLQGKLEYFNPEQIQKVQDMREVYKKVNALVADFLMKYGDDEKKAIEHFVPGREQKIKASPLKLMTHVVTHEFHHKGQIFTMGRLLGYRPPDADIIRF